MSKSNKDSVMPNLFPSRYLHIHPPRGRTDFLTRTYSTATTLVFPCANSSWGGELEWVEGQLKEHEFEALLTLPVALADHMHCAIKAGILYLAQAAT